ncbi:MAG: ArsR/SmtB family transcription factor [Planctomycetota bacterium]
MPEPDAAAPPLPLPLPDVRLASGPVGWRVSEVIAMELETALAVVSGRYPGFEMPELARRVPADWLAEFPDYLGAEERFVTPLSLAAEGAGVLLESDYQLATLAIRETTCDDAVDRLRQLDLETPIDIPARLDDVERLRFVALTRQKRAFLGIGADEHTARVVLDRLSQQIPMTASFFRGGRLHSRFWHWLDRFWYEVYRNWRDERQPVMDAARKRAVAGLGGDHGSGVPALGWLQPGHPLRAVGHFVDAVQGGEFNLTFHIEPFGVPDSRAVRLRQMIMGFALSQDFADSFNQIAERIAQTCRALGDPNRLQLLRLIRSFSMDNTEMATLMQLARPTVSIHARVLREAGLIRTEHIGRQARHEMLPDRVRELIADLIRFLEMPDRLPEPPASE